jgi:predicted DsbA family dithiol-disulfide isomerase
MPAVEVSQLAQVAGELGMDPTAMQTCLDSNKYEKAVKDDQAEGVDAGVRATPTVVIFDTETGKTKSIEGALPYEAFKTDLDALMKGAK